MTAASDLRAWFLARADLTDSNGCWEWRNTHDRDGYARATYYENGVTKSAAGHRLAHELLVGPIPDGLVIDHLCRNRGCVNPGHMEIVTRDENTRRGIHGHLGVLKTHCAHGHPLTRETVYLWKRSGRNPQRKCKICHLRRCKERRAQKAHMSRGAERGTSH